MALTVRRIRQCAICERRDAEVSVTCEGEVIELCGTCFERAEDEIERGDDDDAR